MRDNEIQVGMQVMIREDQKSAPLNGATGTIAAIEQYDNAPIYIVALYGARYRFRSYELVERSNQQKAQSI